MNNVISSPLDAIEQLFSAHGKLIYGEAINQIEHALQCADLAEKSGASDALIVATLLHDVGHMMHKDAAGALLAGTNDVHESLGSKFLARWFGPEVTEPVALHVEAKRFLCQRDSSYYDRLSPISKRTLEIQGGPMTATQAEVFEALPYAMDAVSVRHWDDQGKKTEVETPPFAHFLAIAKRCIAMPYPVLAAKQS